MKSDIVTVLDLGNTRIRCLAVQMDPEGQPIVRGQHIQECKGLKRGVVSDLDETVEAIDGVCRGLQNKTGLPVGPLVVAIGGQHIEGQNAQGFVPIYPRSRLVTREDVLQVVNHSRQLMIPPDREQIQALPREFRIDGQRGIQRPIGMNGSKLEVITYIVTGQTTHIQNMERAINMAGQKVEQMVLKPLASGLGVLTRENMELGAAIVDIGGGSTEIAVFSGGSIAYSATLPVGSMLVTSDISKLIKTSPEEAERLKIFHGSSWPDTISEKETVEVMQLGQTHARPMQRRVLCEIIESRMRELAIMVKQQIEKSGLFGMLPAGVFITGGGSLLPGADRLFEDVLKHIRVTQVAPQMKGLQGTAKDRQGMSVAIGLATFALECSDNELTPASGASSWKDTVRSIRSLFSGRT
jgi:cell division protein FtsA